MLLVCTSSYILLYCGDTTEFNKQYNFTSHAVPDTKTTLAVTNVRYLAI